MNKTLMNVLALSLTAFTVGRITAPSVTHLKIQPATDKIESKIGSVNGVPLMEGDLPKELGSRLYQVRMQEYEILNRQYKNFAFDSLVEKEAKDQNTTKQEYLKKVLSGIKEPSKSEVEQFAKNYNIDLKKDASLIERIKANIYKKYLCMKYMGTHL